MARLPPPVTMITCSIPLAIASSTPYWMVGLSTRGSISLGCALVTGRNRVPRPAAGKIAFGTVCVVINDNLSVVDIRRDPNCALGPLRAFCRGRPHHLARRRQRHLLDPRDYRPDGGSQPQVAVRPPPR